MFIVVSAVLLFSMFLLALCVVFMREVHKKILAANSFGTHMVILTCLYTSSASDGNSLDAAYIYLLMAFIGLASMVTFIIYMNTENR